MPDPDHARYRIQPGTVDLDHLELVALVRVSRGSWMPHFRLIVPPRGEDVWIPQRGVKIGAPYGFPNSWNLVSFVRQDGSYIPITAALERDYTGLANRDRPALDEAIFTISLQLQVSEPYFPQLCAGLISYAVAGVYIPIFRGELTDVVQSGGG